MIFWLSLFCSLSFFGYGTSCLFSRHMVKEFDRYGLAVYRIPTGVLQILAAVGLLVGLEVPVVGGVSALGLALQMACGLGVRISIKDAWFRCLPAAGYMLVCGLLATRLL